MADCCARRERPCGRSAADQCDELGTFHSISASAPRAFSAPLCGIGA
jgi:hypothetical protein